MVKGAVETFDVRFSADAHLLSVLGEQLISSEQVGILELVKNSYDAGANKCTVVIEKLPGLAPTTSSLPEVEKLPGPVISIIDDGVGMDKERIVKGWLRAATTLRTRAKERLRAEREKALAEGRLQALDAIVKELAEANDGRLPLGEKGIGRLATHRLGRYLWLRTKQADDPLEWELRVDWDRFETAPGQDPLDLGAVPLTLKHQRPTFDYGPKNRGTVIRCYGGRHGFTWTEDLLIKTGRSLASLQSPTVGESGFSVLFEIPYDLDEELARPIDDVPPPFVVDARVSSRGTAQITVTFTPPPHLAAVLSEQTWRLSEVDLRDEEKDHWRTLGGFRRPTCGPFEMQFAIWMRDPRWLGTEQERVTKYLDAYGGIGVYRDGLAVMPPEAVAHIDALGLVVRGRKKAANLLYYNMIGQIEITQKLNLEIRDQSSREGQIQNAEFQDLVCLAKAVVINAERKYKLIRKQWRDSQVRPVNIRTLRSHARIAASILDVVQQRYSFTNDELGLLKAMPGVKRNEALSVLAEVSETLRSTEQHLKLIDEQTAGLVEAAGFGLAIAVALHELRKALGVVKRLTDSAAKNQTLTPEQIGKLGEQAAIIQSEMKRIDPMRVTRLERARVFDIRECISVAVGAYRSRLHDAGIKLELPPDDCFIVKARFGACTQVIGNLIDNAVHWLSIPRWADKQKIIRIKCDPVKRNIIVEDTGPGVEADILPDMFEPFVSGKEKGQGLGLFICKWYMEQMKGSIEYLQPGRGRPVGAAFLLDFSKVPEE